MYVVLREVKFITVFTEAQYWYCGFFTPTDCSRRRAFDASNRIPLLLLFPANRGWGIVESFIKKNMPGMLSCCTFAAFFSPKFLIISVEVRFDYFRFCYIPKAKTYPKTGSLFRIINALFVLLPRQGVSYKSEQFTKPCVTHTLSVTSVLLVSL